MSVTSLTRAQQFSHSPRLLRYMHETGEGLRPSVLIPRRVAFMRSSLGGEAVGAATPIPQKPQGHRNIFQRFTNFTLGYDDLRMKDSEQNTTWN